ncbi:glycosyltransferase family 39 protein [Portibacter lacus]|uniref:Glycosyltransferase RgtA/B/C/D-like domain-containing protein n=1 Tax=Portibacter lacus TaxID=1099794 RepID=A0AA37SQN1_9BACT|nr:glycosyltransferase family 39 protein [Portibacter lacus]GLR15950.1 hypothetical protein GCM10007940_05650 [Portibacter lacus]
MTSKVSGKKHKQKPKEVSYQKAYIISAAIIAAISLLIRYFAFDSPIMRDEAVYSLLGNKVMQGKIPFVDFFEMKPPLLYYCYGLGGLIFSWSSFGLRMLGLFLTIVNTGLLILIAKKFSSWSFSLLVGSVGLFLAQNIFNFYTETNSELFIVTFLLSGIYFLFRKTSKWNFLYLFLAGFFIAGTALIKQTYALLGIGAVLLIVIEHYRKDGFYQGDGIIKNVGSLALGAVSIITLCLIPILLTGSLEDAIYWTFTYPSTYSSKISWGEGREYLRIFGGWVFKYQLFTNSLLLLSGIATLILYKAKFYWFILIPFFLALALIFPGLRFYGHYWIPVYAIMPLFLIGLKTVLEKYKIKQTSIIISLSCLLMVAGDIGRNGDKYFERDYAKNTALARSNNLQSIMFQMLNELKKEIQPHHTFGVFGIDANAYFFMEKKPVFDQIYPVMIAMDNEKNRVYQGEAIEEYKNANVDYAFYALTGESWKSSNVSNDFLYNQTFYYLRNNYEPLVVFNYDEKKFYNVKAGDSFDWFKPNQVMTLKRK